MPNQFDIDPARDAEIAALAESLGSMRAAARQLGLSPFGVNKAVRRHRRRVQQEGGFGSGGIGSGPERDGFAPYVVKGVSTYFDKDGNQKGQWVKTRLDDELRQEAIQAAADALAQNIPAAEPVAPPSVTLSDLLNLYVFTDYHMGMLAWHREGGEDWDLEIGERLLLSAFTHMVNNAPPAKVGFICQLGDFFHYDSFKPLTPASGHLLDADSRFPKMVEAGVRVLRRIVALALERHENVHVLMGEGNHDEASSVWLRVMFRALFENEPRVTVEDSPLPFYAYQHGDIMLAFHHGHKVKIDKMPELFAAEFRQMWGMTKKAYGHSGHWHHEIVKGFSGIKWMQHPTLAARDAYAARGGYHAEREAYAITYHRKYGQVSTLTVKPEMFAEAA